MASKQWGALISQSVAQATDVVYPIAFADVPILVVQTDYPANEYGSYGGAPKKGSVTNTGFHILVGRTAYATHVWWITLGS